MSVYKEKKLLPFSPDQLFEIVSDIESYPSFLPWVSEAKVLHKKTQNKNNLIVLEAEINVKFNLVGEKFTSRVILDHQLQKISTANIDGPFKRLFSEWYFKPNDANCEVVFEIDFQFKSFILHNLFSGVFHKAVNKVTHSFEKRARDLHG